MSVAVVTGASSGVGACVSRLLAGKGMNVALVARRTDILENIQKEIVNKGGLAMVFTADVTDLKQVDKVASSVLTQLGTPDLLVNAAAVGTPGDLVLGMRHNWEAMIKVNILGNLNVLGAFLPEINKRGKGHVIQFTGSSERRIVPGLSVYGSACRFWGGINEGFMKEQPSGSQVRLTNIQPDITNTEMIQKIIFGLEAAGVNMDVLKSHLCEMLQPEEVAEAVWEAYNSTEHLANVSLDGKFGVDQLDPADYKMWLDIVSGKIAPKDIKDYKRNVA